MKQTKMYNLVWVVNGIVKETIEVNKPRTICHWRKNQVQDNYTFGLLQVRENK